MLKSAKFVVVLCALLSLMTVAVFAQAPAAPAPAAGGAAASPAGGPGGGQRTPPVMGTITAVDATAKTVKVKGDDGKETSFTVDDTTRIMIVKEKGQPGAAGKIDDLKKDMAARVMSADGKLARAISAAPTAADLPARGNRGGGAGAGAPGGAPAAGGAAPAPAPAPSPAK